MLYVYMFYTACAVYKLTWYCMCTCWLCTPCAVDKLTSYCMCTCQLCMHCRLTLCCMCTCWLCTAFAACELTSYCMCSVHLDFILYCMCSVHLDFILHVQCASWLHTARALCKFIITSYCVKVYLWCFLGHTECVQMLSCKLMYWTLIFFWPPFWILNNTVLVNKCVGC